MIDFFISYNKADQGWAEWIAWHLEKNGYKTIIQAWDFHAGSNFVIEMHKAATEAERTIAVLSPDYLTALYTHPEWAAAFAKDPTGEKKLLIPVRVRECTIQGLLSQISYIDIVGLDESIAIATLLAKIKGDRIIPSAPPHFPGTVLLITDESPRFPGDSQDYSRLVFDQALVGSGSELFSIAFSPDGTLVAAGSNETIFLWDRKKSKRPKRLNAHQNYIYSVAFSSDSRFLASGGEDSFVRVWDIHTGTLVWQERQHTDAVYSVAFSPDGKLLASGGYDRVVNLWDAANGQKQRSSDRSLDGIGRVSSVAFSPDQSMIAIGSLDDTVRLWNLRTRKTSTLKGHASSVESVAFSPDGRLLASCGLDKTVRVWDIARRHQEWSGKEHEYLVRSVAFSPDGATLASASWDKTIRLWDTKTGVLKKTLPFKKDLPWHTDWIWSVAFSPEGMMLASSGSDGKIFIWVVEKSKTQQNDVSTKSINHTKLSQP